jgi:uncharacterized protein (DUF2461 family)
LHQVEVNAELEVQRWGYDWRMATYFSGEALKFLRGLKRNNDRVWFEARRAVFEKELKEPMLKLIGEVNEAMAEFAPMHVRPPDGRRHKA